MSEHETSGPPHTRRGPEPCPEERHFGADPYRWLEGDTSEVRDWVGQQLRWSQQLVDRPEYRVLLGHFERVLGLPRTGRVQEAAGRYFHRVRGGESPNWSLAVSESLEGPHQTLIDVVDLFGTEAVALGDCYPSPDGRLVAFRTSLRGSSFMSLHVVEVPTRKLVGEPIPAEMNPVPHQWHSTNQVAWEPAGTGFFYSRARHGAGASEARYRQQIYFHPVGGAALDDELVFGDRLSQGDLPSPSLSPNGRHLLVTVRNFTGTEPVSAAWLGSRGENGIRFRILFPELPGTLSCVLDDQWIYFVGSRSDTAAGIHRRSLEDGSRAAELVDEGMTDPSGKWDVIGDVVVSVVFDPMRGTEVRTVRAGDRATTRHALESRCVQWVSSPRNGTTVLMGVSGPQGPRQAVRLDLAPSAGSSLSTLHRIEPEEDVEVRMVSFPSRDGTMIPMHIVHRRGYSPDGAGAAVIRGYGGFGKSMKPIHRADVLPFVRQGGVYAEACVRGGGELGAAWHRAGMRENKQNSFDDFNAAGDWLIDQGFAHPNRLGALGWSNGGLLTMAAAVQRPSLWRAVVAGAPVADMSRFHLSHNGRHWISEYGSPDQPEELEWLLRYSPYHNMPAEMDAPAILIFSPDADDRVAPWHGRKMLALWQHASVSDRPILLSAGNHLGHAGGATAPQIAARNARIWAFFFWQLGLETSDISASR
ncbi:MAG: prolyl oligopeptidase family serine peptidase [Actinomycetota bacterium]|nr:prolyl oligopeptidase family serine peptidase [Actinomycetota bacterium]